MQLTVRLILLVYFTTLICVRTVLLLFNNSISNNTCYTFYGLQLEWISKLDNQYSIHL